MAVGEGFTNEREQPVRQNFWDIKLSVHYSLQSNQPGGAPLRNAYPHMHFQRMLWFPFNLGCSHFRWKAILLWFSSIMEHSSLKITSSNCLLSCRHRLLNFSHLIRFGPHINWQYFVTVHAQPSFCRRGFTLSCKNCSSKRSLTLLVSFGAVNLSFFPFQHQ